MRNTTRLLALSTIAILFLISGFGSVYAQTPQKQATDRNIPVVTGTTTDVSAIQNRDAEAETLTANERSRPPLASEPDPTLTHEIFEDFVNGSSYTPLEKINQLASAGGGSGQGWLGGTPYEDAWGVIEAQHGTGTYSRLDLVGKTNNMHGVAIGIGTAYEYQVRFNLANLSNPTNRYIAFDGFFDADTVDPTFNRGILFRYSDDINDGRFQAVVRESEGVETLVDTGVTAETGTWYRLKIVIDASGQQALFFIEGTLVASVSTNLAIGPTNRYTAESNTDRQSGTTPFVSRRFDYVRFRATSGRGSRL
jgi:hypothetical protein